uniref:Ig-like domain-containing protein n=1 Tax=Cyprinus carpio TaxID=7962 RepID=A0A8C1NRU6_CYPCA
MLSVKEGDSVTLYTGVEASKLNYITWYFNDTCIAQINGNFSHNCTDVQCNNGTERFRDRLKLDNQNGSLTIMDIRTTDSGVYTLQIICSSSSSSKTINVAVTGEHVINGESVTLEYVETKVKYYSIKWYYNDNLIAESTGVRSKICTDDQCKERFRNRLKLNQTTGSLNITNMNITDSGLYQLQIIISHSSHCITRVKRFNVTVFCEYISDAVLNFPAVGICVIVVFLLMSATVTAGVIYCHTDKVN